MKQMSIGMDSTLGNWHRMSVAVFGADSRATKFLQDKIDKQGPDEEVIADEGQLIQVLVTIHLGVEEPNDDSITE